MPRRSPDAFAGLVSKLWWGVLASTIVLSCFLSLAIASPEGGALVKMAESWGVASVLRTWVPGGYPCVDWEGVVCDTLGHVTQLNLTNKGLKGPIPAAISSLGSLISLDLSNLKASNGSWNEITGDLNALSSLRNLQHLNLTYGYNGRGLPFPKAVLNLINLITLRLDHAGLIGQFPPRISDLRNLQYLYMGNNSLTGPLPHKLGLLVNLLELTLWDNNFDSQIPPDLQYCKKLTYLNLHNCGLWGGLPVEFKNFNDMQRMRLYKNSLTGPIPDRWNNMKNLTELRLEQNSLYSQLKRWVVQQPTDSVYLGSNFLYGPFPSNVTSLPRVLSLDCNYLSGQAPLNISVNNNCLDNETKGHETCSRNYTCEAVQGIIANGECPPCPTSQTLADASSCICHKSSPGRKISIGTTLGTVVGISVAAATLVFLVIGLPLVRKCKKNRKSKVLDDESSPFDPEQPNFSDVHWEAPKGVQRFTYQELEKATGGFSKDHEIGSGGFGKVFYGTFAGGRTLAIKRASANGSNSSQGITEFRNEVLLLSRLHHKNLVRLEGFCENMQILVYEYMKLGNLHNHLFKKEKDSQGLDWYRRLDIAVGIARALEYLHTHADPPVIHRDVKPSNVLLDDSLTAKVADFGISRASTLLETHISTGLAGTTGYFDPHYFLSHQLTTASDVYSFGVVLLELVTGQKAIDHNREEINLMEWAKCKLKRDGIASIVDPRLKDEYVPDMFFEMVDLALKCTAYEKQGRPTMREVLAILEPLLLAHKTPTGPAMTHKRSTSWESSGDTPSETQVSLTEWSLGGDTRGLNISLSSHGNMVP